MTGLTPHTRLLAAILTVFVTGQAARGLAHVARYRAYRRSYPGADRGRVWRHTR